MSGTFFIRKILPQLFGRPLAVRPAASRPPHGVMEAVGARVPYVEQHLRRQTLRKLVNRMVRVPY